MMLFSYIVTHDTGFAPNPFHGYCTLACCKPGIRRMALVGDWVVGLTSRGERFVYAMKVSDCLDYAAYWADPRFQSKKPDATSSLTKRGDNIYEPLPGGEFRQLPSLHSNKDGSESRERKEHDLDGVQVLVAEEFIYYGDNGPDVPAEFGFLKARRGHRCRFKHEQVDQFLAWVAQQPRGILGPPVEWPVGDACCGGSR